MKIIMAGAVFLKVAMKTVKTSVSSYVTIIPYS